MASKEDKPPGFGLPSIDSGELVEVCELFSPAHFYVHRVEDRGKVHIVESTRIETFSPRIMYFSNIF